MDGVNPASLKELRRAGEMDQMDGKNWVPYRRANGAGTRGSSLRFEK